MVANNEINVYFLIRQQGYKQNQIKQDNKPEIRTAFRHASKM